MYFIENQNPLETLLNALRNAFPGGRRGARHPVAITVHEQRLRFSNLSDFAFCLASRTAVPAWRTDALLRRPLDELRTEAWTVRTLENQIGGILEDGEHHDISCLRTLQALGTRMFSKDHDWRDIFEQLVGAGCAKETHVRMALSKYLQYLGARRHVLELVTALRQDAQRQGDAVTGDAGFAPDKATVMFNAAAAAITPDDEARRCAACPTAKPCD